MIKKCLLAILIVSLSGLSAISKGINDTTLPALFQLWVFQPNNHAGSVKNGPGAKPEDVWVLQNFLYNDEFMTELHEGIKKKLPFIDETANQSSEPILKTPVD